MQARVSAGLHPQILRKSPGIEDSVVPKHVRKSVEKVSKQDIYEGDQW
jgi:uncharacterized protein (UPF0147 family)